MNAPLSELLTQGRWKPVTEVQVTTESSMWLFRNGWYLRLPKTEAPRPDTPSVEDRLKDGRWIPYRQLRWTHLSGGHVRVHALPVPGPVNGRGIHSGSIEHVKGDWVPVVPDPNAPTVEDSVLWVPLPDASGQDPELWVRLTDTEPWRSHRAKWRVDVYRNARCIRTFPLWHNRPDDDTTNLIAAALRTMRFQPPTDRA